MVNGAPLRHVWWSGRSLYARGAISAAAHLAAAVLGADFLTAVRGRPCLRVLQEASHFLDLGAGEIAALLGDAQRSEERRVGNECVSSVDLGGRRIIQKKNQ